MFEDREEDIARIIFPHIKAKHKAEVSKALAKKILEEINKEPPTWYLHG